MVKENLTAEQYFQRGMAKSKSGQYKEALVNFDKAIELKPSSASAYINRGNARGVLQKHKDAISDYDKALELNPESYQSYCNRGLVKLYLKDYEGALFDFTKAIELKPGYDIAYMNRADLKLELNDIEGALSDIETVLKLKPKWSEAYRLRAVIKTRMGNHNGALEDLDKVIKLKPEDKWVGPIVFSEDENATKVSRPKGKKALSFDERRDTKDHRRGISEEDYLIAVINLQLSTETYLRLRMLEKFNFKYPETAKALDIPLTTLWGTTRRVLKKLKKIIPSE